MLWLAAALRAFSASAAYAVRDRAPDGGDVAAYHCLALPAAAAAPPGGYWTRTVDPGGHPGAGRPDSAHPAPARRLR